MSKVHLTSVEDAKREDYANFVANNVAEAPGKRSEPDEPCKKRIR